MFLFANLSSLASDFKSLFWLLSLILSISLRQNGVIFSSFQIAVMVVW